MKKKISVLVLPFLFVLFSNNIFADYYITIYSPEGRPVDNILVRDEASSSQITSWNNETNYWISYYQLNANLIGNSSRTYNCHGYAWLKSEDLSTYWMNWQERDQYINDQNWSNDSQASYASITESQATH